MNVRDETSAVRAELDAAIVRFEETTPADGSRRISGEVVAGPALHGPPGRLHGGLHPVVRLLAPLARVAGPEAVARRPLALDLALRRALPLGAPVPFEGTYEAFEEGFRLSTRFDGTERLDGVATTATPEEAEVAIEPWREAVATEQGAPPPRVFEVKGTPVRAGERLVALDVDEAFWSIPGNHLTPFRRADGALDAVFCVTALDVVGACVMGFEWLAHAYTTHLRAVLVEDPPPDAGPLVVLGDRRRARERAGSTLAPVEVGGVLRAETEVPVVVADRALERIFAHGWVALQPAR